MKSHRLKIKKINKEKKYFYEKVQATFGFIFCFDERNRAYGNIERLLQEQMKQKGIQIGTRV